MGSSNGFVGGMYVGMAFSESSERIEGLEEIELVGIVGGLWSSFLMMSADLRGVRALKPQREFHEELGDLCGGLV